MAAFVLGIAPWVLQSLPVGPPVHPLAELDGWIVIWGSPVGILVAILALRRLRTGRTRGTSLAVIGLLLSVLRTVLEVGLVVLFSHLAL